MAVYQYNNEAGSQLWKVYVNVRSKKNPGIRAQRRVNGIETAREAGREEVRLIRECEREILEKESQGTSWGAVIESWEKFLARDKKSSLNDLTRSDYIATLRKHTGCWWKRQAAEITRADVREVIDQMQASGASVSYQNKMKVIVNRVFVHGLEHSLIRGIDRSPAIGIKLARDEIKKPEILTINEIKRLLVEARNISSPWFPVWATALLTGLRNGELFALLWSDVDWENKAISVTKSYNCRRRLVKSTKSGDWRTVPISTELMALLKELKIHAGDRTHLLPRVHDWHKGGQARELRKFCIGIGITSIKFHTLRACFATQLIRNGIPPIQIQKICGWKDLETMQRYIRLAGIETDGVTESLRVLPDVDVLNQAGGLFGDRALIESA